MRSRHNDYLQNNKTSKFSLKTYFFYVCESLFWCSGLLTLAEVMRMRRIVKQSMGNSNRNYSAISVAANNLFIGYGKGRVSSECEQ